MKLPTILTFFRLAFIPIFVGAFYLPYSWGHVIAATLFAIAGITDWLDGYLARKLEQTSEFGAFLDPVVDKIMVAIALVLLVSNPHLPYIALPAAIIVGREIVVSALREWMAELGKRTSVAVVFVSKIKTALQIVAIVFLLGCNVFHPDWRMYIGYILLYAAAILTLWTMVGYVKVALPEFRMRI